MSCRCMTFSPRLGATRWTCMQPAPQQSFKYGVKLAVYPSIPQRFCSISVLARGTSGSNRTYPFSHRIGICLRVQRWIRVSLHRDGYLTSKVSTPMERRRNIRAAHAMKRNVLAFSPTVRSLIHFYLLTMINNEMFLSFHFFVLSPRHSYMLLPQRYPIDTKQSPRKLGHRLRAMQSGPEFLFHVLRNESHQPQT